MPSTHGAGRQQYKAGRPLPIWSFRRIPLAFGPASVCWTPEGLSLFPLGGRWSPVNSRGTLSAYRLSRRNLVPYSPGGIPPVTNLWWEIDLRSVYRGSSLPRRFG